MSSTNIKRTYLPPQLTVVSIKAERGYADSVASLTQIFLWTSSGGSDPTSQVQDYEIANSWTSGNNTFFN